MRCRETIDFGSCRLSYSKCHHLHMLIDFKLDRQNEISWAFGLGLERICMPLFSIPDIRLFWSTDPRFEKQFTQGKISTFQPFSKFPICWKDLSFWKNDRFHENDLCDVIRDAAPDLVEDVVLVSLWVSSWARIIENYTHTDRQV